MNEVKEPTISVKIGDDDSCSIFKIVKISDPKNHYLLTVGRLIEGEPFGNGYELFLSKQQLEALEKLIKLGQDM